MRIRLKIAKKCCLYLDILSCVNVDVFAHFWLSGSRRMSDATTSTKLELTGKVFWDSRSMLFERMGICVLSTGHECEIRASLVYLLIVKYLSHQVCLTLTSSPPCLSEDIFGWRVWKFLRLYFLQTRHIFPNLPTENEKSTAGKSTQFPYIHKIYALDQKVSSKCVVSCACFTRV